VSGVENCNQNKNQVSHSQKGGDEPVSEIDGGGVSRLLVCPGFLKVVDPTLEGVDIRTQTVDKFSCGVVDLCHVVV